MIRPLVSTNLHLKLESPEIVWSCKGTSYNSLYEYVQPSKVWFRSYAWNMLYILPKKLATEKCGFRGESATIRFSELGYNKKWFSRPEIGTGIK